MTSTALPAASGGFLLEGAGVDGNQLVLLQLAGRFPVLGIRGIDQGEPEIGVIVGQQQVHPVPLRGGGGDGPGVLHVAEQVVRSAEIGVLGVPHAQGVDHRRDLVGLQALGLVQGVQDVGQVAARLEVPHDFADHLEMPQGAVETLPSAQPAELVLGLGHLVPFEPGN
jgi:hypothetical protein